MLFVADGSIPAEDVATVLNQMSDAYPHEQIEGVPQVGREWLSTQPVGINRISRERTAASTSITNARRARTRVNRQIAARFRVTSVIAFVTIRDGGRHCPATRLTPKLSNGANSDSLREAAVGHVAKGNTE